MLQMADSANKINSRPRILFVKDEGCNCRLPVPFALTIALLGRRNSDIGECGGGRREGLSTHGSTCTNNKKLSNRMVHKYHQKCITYIIS